MKHVWTLILALAAITATDGAAALIDLETIWPWDDCETEAKTFEEATMAVSLGSIVHGFEPIAFETATVTFDECAGTCVIDFDQDSSAPITIEDDAGADHDGFVAGEASGTFEGIGLEGAGSCEIPSSGGGSASGSASMPPIHVEINANTDGLIPGYFDASSYHEGDRS